MGLLTQAELKQHVETDLDQAALQRLMDDAEAEIIKRFGAHGDKTSTQIIEDLEGRAASIFPYRPETTIVSVTEYEIDGTETVLALNDYRIWHGGREISRRIDGTNPRGVWAPRVRIIYLDATELPNRKRVQADLVRLAIEYRALKSESSGDLDQSYADYEAER